MSSADLETVRALAALARLELSDAELSLLHADLARILAHFEVLARHEEPTAPLPFEGAARVRQDQPVPSRIQEAILASAPEAEEGFFLVPKTVGGER